MTKMPAASHFGAVDIVEVRPAPDPGRVYAYDVGGPTEHTVSEVTNLIFIDIMPAAAGRHLMFYGGLSGPADADYSIPVSAASTPLAVAPGSTFTLLPDGASGDIAIRIQEVTV